MKKFTCFNMALFLLVLCGCHTDIDSAKSTQFLLNTIVTLDVSCDDDTLKEAFSLCRKYEDILSKTVSTSDVSRLNESDGFVKVSEDTRFLIEKSLYYSSLTKGRFDITVCPVTNLWDFEGNTIPNPDEIAEALKNVDYESIEINGNEINLNGKSVDLGGIAKGYIADRLLDFFKEKNVKSGIINLGGNIVTFGDSYKNIGIAKPFCDTEVSATLKVKNKSVVTSGIYQRYIKKDGRIYHHILDVETGYGVESDLSSATVIADSSVDCDALSTVCILLGSTKAKDLIENTKKTEAVFITRDGGISFTSGLKEKDGILSLS